MTNAAVFNFNGESSEKMTLPKEIFEVKVSPLLLAQAVRVYLANQRKAHAKTKTRGEVNKTTAKMYKQKGTGRARHGAYSAPIFVGGGIAHGPDGKQNYKLDLPQKMVAKALMGALSFKAEKKNVLVIRGADKASGKTKETKGLWLKLNEGKKKLLLVTGQEQKQVAKAMRNLEGLEISNSQDLNTYEVLAAKQVAFTEEAIEELKTRFGLKKGKKNVS